MSDLSFPISYAVNDIGEVEGDIIHDLLSPKSHVLKLSTKGDCKLTLKNIPTLQRMEFFINSTGPHNITLPNGVVILGKGKDCESITCLEIDQGILKVIFIII